MLVFGGCIYEQRSEVVYTRKHVVARGRVLGFLGLLGGGFNDVLDMFTLKSRRNGSVFDLHMFKWFETRASMSCHPLCGDGFPNITNLSGASNDEFCSIFFVMMFVEGCWPAVVAGVVEFPGFPWVPVLRLGHVHHDSTWPLIIFQFPLV